MIKSEYIELKGEMCEFKSKLTSIQTKLNKKIIIFVDELDRCHPMYTIKTLEIIKHFFGIPNIIFVLSVDKKQIENSVRQIFGVNIGEENGYLRKFIDVDFQLPTPSMEQLAYYNLTQLWDKINKFIEDGRYYNYNLRMKRVSYTTYPEPDYEKEQNYLSHLISEISKVLNFSARDLEKFFVRLNLTLDILLEKDILFIEPVLVLNAIAIVNMEVYDDYILKNLKMQSKEINKILPLWKDLFNNQYKAQINDYRTNIPGSPSEISRNTYAIYELFMGLGIENFTEQETYLKNYPEKIKFIHNFNNME